MLRMINDIRNNFMRRVALVLTVVGIVVFIGPLQFVNVVLWWIEDEFEVNLRAIWRGRTERKER